MNQKQTAPRTALITGGVGGIGKGIAIRLANEGYRVAISDMHEGAARDVAAGLPGEGHIGVAIDVTNAESVSNAVGKAEEALGVINALIHAAGIQCTEPDGRLLNFWESGIKRWDKTMEVNARGTFLVAAEYMRRRVVAPASEGRIVLFSSVLGQVSGTKTFADYSASKSAVLGFMRAAARECTAGRHGQCHHAGHD